MGRPGVAVIVGVLLCAPSLGNGLNLDDVLHAARMAEGEASPWELFALFGGDAPLFASDDMPWWRDEGMSLRLLRPLASVSHLVDHALFAGRPLWMHVHSLLWYALLIAAAGRVYRRLVPIGWACAVATLLFAVDHSHGMVVGWLAARSGLIGATLGLLGLLAHVRWRAEGWRPGAILAPAGLLLALLANEGAIGICGYLAAHAACLERGPWARRVMSLIPAGMIVVAWRACYVLGGFGAAHSGFYFDVGADPLGFVGRSLIHGAILVWSQVFVSAGEGLGMLPGLYLPGALVAAVMLAAVAWLLRGELRRSPLLRFWAVGTLLCALPLGSTLPTDRQLLLIGFGVFGFAAQLWAETREAEARRAPVRWLGRGWLVLHAVLSPLLLPLRSVGPAQIHAVAVDATAAYVPTPPPPRVIVLRVPSELVMLYGRAEWQLRGREFPDALLYLYAGLDALTVVRRDARTLELRPERGWLFAPLDRLFRGEDAGFAVGASAGEGPMRVEIVEVTDEGRPLVVRVRFDRSLEDPSMAWFSWEASGIERFVPPEIGETRALAATHHPMLSP